MSKCTTGRAEDALKETLTSGWSMELHYKLVESAEDGDLVFALNAESWVKEKDRRHRRFTLTSNNSRREQPPLTN